MRLALPKLIPHLFIPNPMEKENIKEFNILFDILVKFLDGKKIYEIRSSKENLSSRNKEIFNLLNNL